MKRITLQVVIAAALVGLGWTAGQAAQTAQAPQATQAPAAAQADFELKVTSPSGETTITCVRGCALQFIRQTPNRSSATPSFTYSCGNASGTAMCGGSVHGFVIK